MRADRLRLYDKPLRVTDMLKASRWPSHNHDNHKPEGGVALILVLFIVALASVIVINLSFSTQLGSRLNAITIKSFEAEYLLKSGLTVARVMIQQDESPEDSAKDIWGALSNGLPVPPETLGIQNPNIRLALEIRPEESKIPLRALVPIPSGGPDPKWRDLLVRLFERLGFDNDEQVDHTGLFPDRVFSPQELVAILIDSMDENNDSYQADDFASGVEGDLPAGTFSNQRLTRVGELSSLPGFTSQRVRLLTPFVTVFGNGRINVNLAPKLILEVLHADITADNAASIIDFRTSEAGPYTEQNLKTELTTVITPDVYDQIASMISVRSNWYQVLAKVDYDYSSFFIRAFLSKNNQGELPDIRSLELF